nr:MAG TPA: RecT protein [Caudoviricetes sp.]
MSNTQVATQQNNMSLGELMHSPAVVGKLNEVWNSPQMANSFMSSVISVANGNPQLRNAEPMSIIGAAMVAATMQLQVIPTLGQCYIIPYGKKAQFQVGYLGLLQLCQRSGQFKKILAAPVHEGEYVSGDEFDEEYVFDKKQKKSDKVIGYMAKFELLNGFTKVAYWDIDKVKAHATKFSQAFRAGFNSPWKSDFDAMAQKTVLKSILKFAPKSIEMQNAVTFDQSVINTNTSDVQDLDIDAFAPEYVDNIESEKKENIAAKAAEAAKVDAAKKEEKK